MTKKELRTEYEAKRAVFEKSASYINEDVYEYAKENLQYANPERSLKILEMRKDKKTLSEIAKATGITTSSVNNACVYAQRKYRQHLSNEFHKNIASADDIKIEVVAKQLKAALKEAETGDHYRSLISTLNYLLLDIQMTAEKEEVQKIDKDYILDYFDRIV